MIKRITIFVLFVLYAAILPAYAKNDSGKNLILFGDSASSLGLGGIGVSSFGADLFYLNPASIAPLERFELGLQYGTLGFRYSNPDVSFAIPSSYGVFGGSSRMISIPQKDTNDIEKGYLISLGGAKNFTERLMFGAALNYFTGKDPADSLTYAGITIGTIYKIDFESYMKKGFGIYEPKIGASVNAGLPFGENSKFVNFNQVTLGYNFSFYKRNDLNLKFYNDISAINTYKKYPVKFGLESVIKNRYAVRGGFTAPQSYEYGDYTFGLGYLFKTEELDLDVNYALVHYSKLDFVHYAGVNIKYGKLDTEPPETKIAASEEYISPNYDGRQDFLIFKPEVEDKSTIKGWKLQILSEGNDIIKEYRVSERDIDESLSLKGFFMKIWQKKESLIVPEKIMWDGTDTGRKIVPDGVYSYSFLAWDERDNISIVKTGAVHVDNTSPGASLESSNLFSPNGDNVKDMLDIKLNIATSAEDMWTAGFVNPEGKTVKSYKWSGSAVPKKISWDGKDDNGAEASEGLYNFIISSTDKAGNSARAEKKEITLTRKYQSADITCSNEYFSYKESKNVIFYPVLSDTAGLENWKISIMKDSGRVMKEIKGTDNLPGTVMWTVLDEKENMLDDDKYYFNLSAEFNSGNKPFSFRKEIIIDSTPPKVSLDYSPSLFSPDEDGENDILTINPEASDNTGIKDWNLDILAPSGKTFKSFSGKNNPPSVINWDGIGKDNDVVESAVDYFLVFSARDLAGNVTKSDRIKLPVDILVIVTERGLKIRISNIEFAFNKAMLSGAAFPILNRVTELLNKYGKYSILIEGHTDDIGEEEYNLKLSEARAKTVMDYLISKGVNEKRLTFRGIGEIMPFLPNTDNENRRRNRRVEFLLIKEEVKE
jgi:outer membrane protein OmpA-like peptidoglycan-associated protein/flagellar hook assembly protein FlgD